MNVRRGRRALRGIERDLAASDPDLTLHFLSFTGRTRTAKMPDTEKIRTRRLRLFGRLGRHADRH
jgi:hypothetical protein